MGKKSAKSKGYRNYKKVEKGFTKKDIITMCIGLAVIVVIVACALLLPDFIEAKKYNYLPVEDGKIANMQDNWLVYNRDSSSSKNKYVLRGTVEGAAEGYEFDRNDNMSETNYANVMYFKPTEDNAEPAADHYYILAGGDTYDKLAEQSLSMASMYADEILTISEAPQDTKVGDVNAKYYVLEEKYENIQYDENGNVVETEEGAEPSYTYVQSVYFFLENTVGEGCFSMCASNSGDSQDCFTDSESIIALLTDAAQYVKGV